MNKTQAFDQKQIEYFKLRYGCFLKVLDDSAMSPLTAKDEFRSAYAIGCVVFGVMNIAANSLLLIGLIKTNKKFGFVQKLFIYLTCTDLIAGCILMPTLVYYQLVGLRCFYMALMTALAVYVAASDAGIVLVILIFRLHSIRRPLEQNSIIKKKVFIILIQFSLSLSGSLVFYITYFYRGTLADFQFAGYVANGLITFLSLAVLVCVLFTLFQIKKHVRRNANKFRCVTLARHKKSTGSLLIIASLMIFFIVVQSPVFFYLHVLLRNASLLSGETFRLTKKLVDITVIVNLMNTSMNSIVIMVRSEKLKKYYWKMLFGYRTSTTTSQ